MTASIARVGDLAEQIRGVTYGKEDASKVAAPGYLPILRAGNITDTGLVFEDLVFVPADKISSRQRIRKGDIVIAASSGSLDVVGKAAPALADFDGGFGAFCKVIRPSAKVEASYLAQFFKTPMYRRTISGLAAGANINNLKSEHLDDLTLPLPSMPEQCRIAAILDQADALRAQRREVLVELDKLVQAVFVEMFGDTVTNPMEWPRLSIGRLADVQGGLQVTSARKDLPIEVPYLRVANVHRGYLNLDEIKTIRATPAEIARTTLCTHDLLVVEGHGNPEEIGRAALWNGELSNCVHQNHLIRVRFDTSKVDPVYACTYLNSPGGRRHLLRAGKTTSGLNTISVSNVREAPVALPPVELQKTFATRVKAIEVHKVTRRAALAESDALFTSLQHHAFSGAL